MSIRYCVDCGNGIPSKRIQLVPTAVRCISCEAEYEKTVLRGFLWSRGQACII